MLLEFNETIDKPDWSEKYQDFATKMGNLESRMNSFERKEAAKMQDQLYQERINP